MSTVLCGQGRSTIPAKLAHHAEIRLWERTRLTKDAIKELLATRKYVFLRMQEGFKRAMVVYSEPDDACYVVVQNYRTREVVTVLPLGYWAFDTLTENSAQAWVARELVLGVESELAGLHRATEAEGGESLVASVPSVVTKQAERYVSWHVQRKRLAEALQAKAWCPTPNARPTDEERAAAERGKELLKQFTGVDLPSGKAHPECVLVLKLLRDPPYFPIVIPCPLLQEDLASMLVEARFVATMVRKMAGRELLNEDLLGVHIEIGEKKFEFSESQQHAFFAACASCLEDALREPAEATSAAQSACEVDSEALAGEQLGREELAVEAHTADVTPTMPGTSPAAGLLVEEALAAPGDVSHLVDQVTGAPETPPQAANPVEAPGLGKAVRVEPAPTEFEALLMETGYGIRRPETTHKKYRAA